jgi:transposase-like protein
MNVLNKLPKSMQPKAKVDLKEIWMAESREDAEKAFDRFLARYEAKYDKAATCLAKDREALLAFYDFLGQSIGSTSAPAIRSKAPSRPSVTAPHEPRAASRTKPA